MKVTYTPVRVELVRPPDSLKWYQRLWYAQRWRVIDKVRVEICEGSHQHIIEVDAGLVTDFASVPRLFKIFFPESMIIGVGALVHDQLYKTGEVGKRIADAILAGLLQDCDGATNFQAELFFLAVHMFGFAAWNQHREKDGKS
ncbi:MAG: DUF1353 domain-containing protein [Verrucomicrobiia bacterium]|jgi:hypothetical protein